MEYNIISNTIRKFSAPHGLTPLVISIMMHSIFLLPFLYTVSVDDNRMTFDFMEVSLLSATEVKKYTPSYQSRAKQAEKTVATRGDEKGVKRYEKRLAEHIAKHLNAADLSGLLFSVYIFITLDGDGNILRFKLMPEAEDANLYSVLQQAIKGASPAPPPPSSAEVSYLIPLISVN